MFQYPFEVLEHWLKEYKLDGFRFDLSKGFTQNSSTEQTASNYDASRIAILKDYNSKIKSVNPKAYTILEHFCAATEELELVQDGMMVWANANNAFCQGIMGYSSQSDFSSLSAQSRQWNLKGMIGYQESHDEERTVYKAKTYGVDGVKNSTQVQMERAGMNAAFLFTIPGPKMIWQFGEMGYDYSIDYNGRVGKKPVRWDYLENPDRAKLADTYATLLSLRNEFPQVFANPSTETLRVSESYWSNGRFITLQHPDLNVVLAGNYTTSATSVTLPFTQTGTWYDLFTGESYVVDNLSNPVNVTLPGSSFKLLTSKKTLTDSEPISLEKPVVVYPNPTNGFIQFSDSAPKRVTLYNALGRQVLQQQVTDGTLNIGNLPAGPYFMQVYTADKMESLKILKR